MLLRKFSVSIFGTSASGLARRDSDLDLLLDLDGRGNREVSRDDVPMILHACEMALQAAGAEELQCIANARIPILRGKIQQTRFDLSLGTLCGLWNTTFLHHCAENDPSVVPLCSCVATWSKIQGVNDSPNGLLSTYSVLLLVIFFLQLRGSSLHLSTTGISESERGELTKPTAWNGEKVTDEELGRNFLEFFAFVGSFRWDCWIASVRLSRALPRSCRGRAWRVAPLCIEDPFETHLNTCRRVNPRARRQILGAFQTALRNLLQGKGLQALLGSAFDSSSEFGMDQIHTSDELRYAMASRGTKNASCLP